MFKVAVVHNDAILDEHEIKDRTEAYILFDSNHPKVRIVDVDDNIYIYWNVQSIDVEKILDE